MTFTTYAFPETDETQMPPGDQRIAFLIPAGLTPEQNQLLERISGALQADFTSDVLCLVHTTDKPALLPASAHHHIALMISFGIAPEAVGIWIDLPGAGICRLEHMTFIRTSSPDHLLADPTAKKILWQHMQAYLDQTATPGR